MRSLTIPRQHVGFTWSVTGIYMLGEGGEDEESKGSIIWAGNCGITLAVQDSIKWIKVYCGEGRSG